MRELEVMPLLSETDPAWVDVALSDFDKFLIDHAACERKASALAMSLVVKYPDKPKLVEPMIALAREELAHFHDVFLIINKRGLKLGSDEQDPYLKILLKHVRHGREEHFLDRLLISGIVEARGCERFKMVADALEEPELRDFYQGLARAEAGHYMIFIRIARQYFPDDVVHARVMELLKLEAEAVASLPHRPAVH